MTDYIKEAESTFQGPPPCLHDIAVLHVRWWIWGSKHLPRLPPLETSFTLNIEEEKKKCGGWKCIWWRWGGCGKIRKMPLSLKKMFNPIQAKRRPNPKTVSNTISMQPSKSANKSLCSEDFECFLLDLRITQILQEVAYGILECVKFNKFVIWKTKTGIYNYHLHITDTSAVCVFFCYGHSNLDVQLSQIHIMTSDYTSQNHENKYVFLQTWLWGLWGWRAARFWTCMKFFDFISLIYLEVVRLPICKPLTF